MSQESGSMINPASALERYLSGLLGLPRQRPQVLVDVTLLPSPRPVQYWEAAPRSGRHRSSPVEHQPAEHQPAEHQPAEHQPAEHQPAEHQPAEHQPAEDQPAEHQPAEHQPAEDQPAEDQPAEDQPAEDQPAEDQPAEDQPAEDQADAEPSGGLRDVPALTGPPSAVLFAALAELPVAAVVDEALVGALGAGQRLIGAITAQMLVATAELHARRVDPLESELARAQAGGDITEIEWATHAWDIGSRAVRDEVALALSCSRTAASHHVETALSLTRDLPRTLDALAEGELEPRKASVIADLVGAVEDAEIRGRLEDAVLPKAQRWTLPTLREEIKKLTLKLDPEGAAKAHEKARSKRRVALTAADDDMMELWALLPADDGVRLRTALDIAADAAKAPGDERTADQRRLDALVDVICGALVDVGAPGDGRTIQHSGDCCSESSAAESSAAESSVSEAAESSVAEPPGVRLLTEKEKTAIRKRSRGRGRRGLRHEVQVVVPFETITGDADEPGYLARYGPISAHLARRMAWQVADQGVWRCVVTDDVHGTVMGLGASTFSPDYAPSERLRRLINARDRYCDFPGCRAAAAVSDKDHQVPWPGGATCECNLCNRCPHHHRVKHETSFSVRFSDDPGHPPGTVIWTSPTGREHPEFPAVVGVPRAAARPGRTRPPGQDGSACQDQPGGDGSPGWCNPEPPPF